MAADSKLDTFVYLFPTASRDREQLLSGVPDSLVFVAVNVCLTVGARCVRRLVTPSAANSAAASVAAGAALCDRLCFPADGGRR